MDNQSRPRRNQARPRREPFPGQGSTAGQTAPTWPVSLAGNNSGSTRAASSPSPTLPAQSPVAGEWGWGRNIAVGVIKHIESGLWQSWVSQDGAIVRSLTAHKEFWQAHQVASLYAEGYTNG